MERSEAKEGVRVRYVGLTTGELNGKLGKLEASGVSGANLAHVRFDDETIRFCNIDNLTVVEEFTPPALSPIVTKRLIKLDTFGIVRIDQVSDSYRGVSLRIHEPGYLTAEQLREAAHVLNQIAEVLEENAS